MAFLETEQDYIDAGVAPPDVIPHGLPGDDNQQILEMIGAEGRHKHHWTQQGNFIECTAGRHVHGHGFDHLNKVLVGTDANGLPVFKDLDLKAQTVLDNNEGASRPKQKRGMTINNEVSNGKRQRRRRTNR